MNTKYIPKNTEEPRKKDKDAIAKTLLAFSDEPLHVKTIAELTDLSKEAVNGLVWRMANTVSKWPNIRRVADGTYMWDTNLRTRDARNNHAKSKKSGRKPVVIATQPATTWTSLVQVDGKHILKHSDGSVWVASRLDV